MSRKPNFKELLSLDRDKSFSAKEKETLSKLLASDDALADEQEEFNLSLNFLKDAAYDEEEIKVDDTFNGRVIRRYRVEKKNRSWSAMLPAVVGAVTAAVGLIAIIQVVSAPVTESTLDLQNQKAELETSEFPVIPEFTE